MTAKDISLAVIIPLALAEFGSWCGWLANALLPLAAVLRYGRCDRAAIRCEEWADNLREIPGQLTKLTYSLGHLLAGSVVAVQRTIKKIRSTRIAGRSVAEQVNSYSGSELDWRERALCLDVDPDAFFPENGGSVRRAKIVCRGCEVRADCLEYALEHDERFGIWGGLSERERRRLKRGAA